MKKVLLATTMLVATAGFAAAEVKLSGSANMGLKYAENGYTASGDDIGAWYEIDVDLVGTTETDSGLTFSASMDLDFNANTSSDITDPEVSVSGAFGSLTIGAVDPGSDNLTIGLADPGFDGIGVDDIAEALYVSSAADALYMYSVSGFTVALSTDVNGGSDNYSIGLGYATDAYDVALGYDDDGVGDAAITLDGSYKFGAATVGAMYTDKNDDSAYGVEASYALAGGITLSATYAKSEIGGVDADGFGIGAAYDLGGATLAGAIGEVADETVADLGVSFKF